METAPRYKPSAPPDHFWMGRPVGRKYVDGDEFFSDEPRLGHVTGFTTNVLGEIVVMVKWCNGLEYPVHPANLELKAISF